MTSVFTSIHRLMQMFDGRIQEFTNDIDNVHMVWLEEIQQEANRMFSSDFSAEPELMPKTPSQKKGSRRRRVSSSGRQEEPRNKRRFSKGKRSNLHSYSVKTLNLISEVEDAPEATTSKVLTEEPKRSTRRAKQTQSEVAVDAGQPSHSSTSTAKQTQAEVAVDAGQPSHSSCETDQSPALGEKPETVEEDGVAEKQIENDGQSDSSPQHPSDAFIPPQTAVTDVSVMISAAPQMTIRDVSVMISAVDRKSAEKARKPEPSPGRSATKIAIAGTPKGSRRSSVRHSLTLRRSLAGLRHSMTQESIRRASRRSFLKKKARLGNSTCSSNISEDACTDTDGEEVEEYKEQMSIEEEPAETETEKPEASPERIKQIVEPAIGRLTRAKTRNTGSMASPGIGKEKLGTQDRGSGGIEKESACRSSLRSSQSGKRKAADVPDGTPRKRPSPPKRSQTAIKPHMRSFLLTVQKNKLLMMTPGSLDRSNVMKSFIKHTTPMKIDHKERERRKLEAVKKKQEQEEERKKKMDEEKRRKQEDMKRKRDERLKRVVEARVKEELKEEEKKKKIEQKMAQIDEKNDKLREEKAKKKVATKRQEELDQRRKLEEEARRKKIQQAEEEEIRQQKLLAKRRAEEEEQRARKLAEARRAHELKEQELERERERQAAAERQRVEKEKALALQRELERAAREKERRELEEKIKALEVEKRNKEEQQRLEEERAAKQREAAAAAAATAAKNVLNTEHTLMKTPGKTAGLNVTIDIERSPQSYDLTPQGRNKPVVINPNPEDYGMDQNSDDSTDDESAPRKPIPSWAEGLNLKQAIMKQYYHPLDMHSYFGEIDPPNLESIFFKSKPRYYKRTSSAVWKSPPQKAM